MTVKISPSSRRPRLLLRVAIAALLVTTAVFGALAPVAVQAAGTSSTQKLLGITIPASARVHPTTTATGATKPATTTPASTQPGTVAPATTTPANNEHAGDSSAYDHSACHRHADKHRDDSDRRHSDYTGAGLNDGSGSAQDHVWGDAYIGVGACVGNPRGVARARVPRVGTWTLVGA
jgi:hypothetical protein